MEVGGVARKEDDDNNVDPSMVSKASVANGTFKMPLKFTCAKFRVKFLAIILSP